jgi:ribonuclease P protein component
MDLTRRFPRTARVRARSDFDRIFKHGRRVALPVLALHWHAEAPANPGDPAPDATVSTTADPAAPVTRPGPAPEPRLGLAVSRKVDVRAVVRNRVKRELRETFRAHRVRLLPGDYVCVARPGAAALAPGALRDALLSLLQRAGALPPAAPPGTMPAAACTDRVQPPSR